METFWASSCVSFFLINLSVLNIGSTIWTVSMAPPPPEHWHWWPPAMPLTQPTPVDDVFSCDFDNSIRPQTFSHKTDICTAVGQYAKLSVFLTFSIACTRSRKIGIWNFFPSYAPAYDCEASFWFSVVDHNVCIRTGFGYGFLRESWEFLPF